MSRQFSIVDVFAQERYTGNQLAVVTDAAGLDAEEMQAIAAEMDYSETTFVTGEPTDGAWPVRIFTPTDEVPFAGHPTLGTAAVIRDSLADGAPENVVLDLAVGEVPVERRQAEDGDRFWMRQQPPEFGERLGHADLAAVLGLEETQLDTDYPVQIVSTGLATIIVPLRDRAALTGIELDLDAYHDLVGGREAKLVHAFCPDPRADENDIAARMFAPALGVREDPATGSANGCLAAYLSEHEYFGAPAVEARVEQGYELGRPSLLSLRASPEDDTIAVEVGGEVVPVARGELL
ncbi:PhzF family phenazine biosynthesis isomerase [Halovenus sp. WSH3]|uniref:PhzF family phenazine biosynthesis isomerase n=1 Tax=Halovenus carboxidivorans TaxID=2692199 RepID=A0A6B0SX44_9EURY|nr:PhzF family phenazine biosynthesis protein [Halovenus carboxidivorans]MXR50278.1 PhzF family phenazine biosynthesis isomerase [Halovenus carboxidivorans]